MSLNDYVKFVTQQLVMKIDEPKSKKEKEEHVVEIKKPLSNRAFGIIPLGLSMFVQRKRNN
ncbi:YqzE family protein [Alkalihalobacillus pseudalcaliphilus]|uniref:YqzE family protein n=1 Tax=Alkalihalobacillus pseudalcaliphilus TaxID=79884 RepID=UPI00064DAC59|nr:YqzE family protein [Alkalihalobacillus pseudalcaliphilus]KMK76967.1 hypothetical protein AB990_05240 [Alkalihalobacillus pseudalcaliphilus]